MRFFAIRPPVWVLTSATVVVALLSGAVATTFGNPAATQSKITEPITGVPGGLRQLGRSSDVKIGAAAQPQGLAESDRYRALLSQEFNSVTSESQLKWDVVEPVRGQYDWTGADALVDFAKDNHQSVRGHTLVWHDALPGWLVNGTFTADQLRHLLREHIQTVVSRYRGRVAAWDVVNEPIADTGGQLRKSLWLNTLGPGYITDALRWAHEADPAAKLYINDYGVENINAKSNALYNVVAGLRRDGIPIDGVGFQSHLALGVELATLDGNLRRFTDLGIDVAITEMDVRLRLPTTPTQHVAQAGLYMQVLQACLGTPRCVSFTVWGFTDQYSWIPHAYPGWGDACLFDIAYYPKPAYQQLRQLLAGTRGVDPRRRLV
jgi:endo-1,4-beta-xylanase